MEQRAPTDQLPSFHPGYYDVPSFEILRKDIQARDQLFFKTQNSAYAFLVTEVLQSTPYGPFAARGVLVDAPYKALVSNDGTALRVGEECYFQFTGSNQSVEIFLDAPLEGTERASGAIRVTTTPVKNYGLKKSN